MRQNAKMVVTLEVNPGFLAFQRPPHARWGHMTGLSRDILLYACLIYAFKMRKSCGWGSMPSDPMSPV